MCTSCSFLQTPSSSVGSFFFIAARPSYSPTYQTAFVGQSYYFSFNYSGTPPMEYSWYKNGYTFLPDSSGEHSKLWRAQSSLITILKIKEQREESMRERREYKGEKQVWGKEECMRERKESVREMTGYKGEGEGDGEMGTMKLMKIIDKTRKTS